jgi:pentose-5-phosphate-3-epimerase
MAIGAGQDELHGDVMRRAFVRLLGISPRRYRELRS